MMYSTIYLSVQFMRIAKFGIHAPFYDYMVTKYLIMFVARLHTNQNQSELHTDIIYSNQMLLVYTKATGEHPLHGSNQGP